MNWFHILACVNIYNDQYCKSNVGNCWTLSIGADLVKNCRKTCVCKCCPLSPTTVPTTAYVHNATRYTTVSAFTSATTSVEIVTTSALTSATTTVEITTTAKDISSTPQTTSTITNSTLNEERTTVQIGEGRGARTLDFYSLLPSCSFECHATLCPETGEVLCDNVKNDGKAGQTFYR